MEREAAQNWLDRYVAAWKSYDRDDIAALFAPDITYRYHPHDEPVVGGDAVVASWLGENEPDGASSRDQAGTYDARYAPAAIDGDVVVATGTSRYADMPGGAETKVYDNCFVMRFDEAGRCADFVEYYVRRSAR